MRQAALQVLWSPTSVSRHQHLTFHSNINHYFYCSSRRRGFIQSTTTTTFLCSIRQRSVFVSPTTSITAAITTTHNYRMRVCSALSAATAAMVPLSSEGWIPTLPQCRLVSSSLWSLESLQNRSRSSRATLIFQRMATSAAAAVPAPSLEESLAAVAAAAKKVSTRTNEKAIAEGAIVSQFPGGLTVVRINEDLMDAVVGSDSTIRPATVVGVTPQFLAATKNSATSCDYQGKQVVFPNGMTGVVVAHRPPLIFCYSDDKISLDDGLVQVLNSDTKMAVSTSIHQVDCFGRVVGVSPIQDPNTILTERKIFAPIPLVSQIALINNPMLTGITMMDTLAPVGRGQNMLLLGSDMSQMRDLARDFVQTQLREDTTTHKSICVYASTEYDHEAARQRLVDAGISDKIHFVGSMTKQNHPIDTRSATVPRDEITFAAQAVLLVNTACAIAESYALEQGLHALVVVDNIDLYKTLWDATTRVLVDVFGVNAVVQSDRDGGSSSEMRNFYSSLIQRAGQYNQKMGGGSVTLLLLTSIPSNENNAKDETIFQPSDFSQSSERMKERIDVLVKKGIPLTARTLRKINIPIPTVSEGERRLALQHIDELISMSDGQVWLDESLARSGQQPPMDPQRSVTRIGIGADTQSRADAPAIRRIAEGVRLELAQAANMMTGREANAFSQKQIRRQQALLLAMHQPAGSGSRRLSESCIVLLAARQGYLDKSINDGALAGTKDGESVVQNLLRHVRKTASQVLDEIDASLDVKDESREELTASIAAFFKAT